MVSQKNMFKNRFILTWLLLSLAVAFSPVRINATDRQAALAVEAIGMTVSDMDRSLDFYTRVLPFQKVSDVEVWGEQYERLQGLFGVRMRIVRLQLGEEFIELTEYLTPKGRPIPVDARSNDHWFQHIAIVVSDMDKAYQQLRSNKVQHVSTAPQTIPAWNKNAAGIRAFYFRDPDQHNLEIICFPAGKGDPKWQNTGDRLFLGIDHTAIVVSDTEQSLKFYRDALGLNVAGESENYATEQEHLNNVFGARLQITGLRAQRGPGIEFLEYLAPSDGRSTPVDIKANDLMHWQTTVVLQAVEATVQSLGAGHANLVSPGIVELSDEQLAFKKGFLVRDPDGHAMMLVEK